MASPVAGSGDRGGPVPGAGPVPALTAGRRAAPGAAQGGVV